MNRSEIQCRGVKDDASFRGLSELIKIPSQFFGHGQSFSSRKQLFILFRFFCEMRSSTCRLNLRCPVLLQVTQKSGAHVRISSDGGESECQNVSFLLHGSEEQVLLARCVLQNLVIDSEPAEEVLEVPQTAFGRIIGNAR